MTTWTTTTTIIIIIIITIITIIIQHAENLRFEVTGNVTSE